MTILTVEHVAKSFGSKKVLRDLSFSIPTGTIFGFVGENGSGKTTTMKIILGLEKADKGEIMVCGKKVHFGATETNRDIGYLPDVPEFYGYLTPSEYLKLCAEITGIKSGIAKKKIPDMLEMVGLSAAAHRKIRGFSRGMKQRLGIAQALLNDPKLLICDEPTSALDPAGRLEFLNLLASLRGKVTVLFSTHILNDVERISDEVGILHDGKLQASGTLAALKKQYAAPKIALTLETASETQKLASQLKKTAFAKEVGVAPNNTLRFSYNGNYETTMVELLSLLLQQHLTPTMLKKQDPTLEEIFLEVIK